MRLRNLSVKKKFIYILILFMLLPTCVISLWMYRNVSNSWIQKEYSIQSNEIGNILRTTEMWLEDYEDILYDAYIETNMMMNLNKSYHEWSSEDHIEVLSGLSSLIEKDEYIKSAYFFSETGDVTFRDVQMQGNYQKIYRENPQWSEVIHKRDGKIVWIPTYVIKKNQKNYQYFSCGITLKNLNDIRETYGTLILNIDLQLFDDLFELLGQLDDSTVYLVTDTEGNIIWSNKFTVSEYFEKPFSGFASSDGVSDGFANHLYCYEGTEYITTLLQSDYNGWNYISMKSREEVMKSGRWVTINIIVQIFFILLFAVFGAVILQYYIIRPIQKMVVAMSRPESELLGQRVRIEQEDEIGRLYQSFNEMCARIEENIRVSEETNKREREYQIQALNAQINPHFMYNTLDTIHWMALEIPAPKICQLITSFSDILRYSISKKSSVVTLEDEITCIRNYIMIYEERYEKKFGHFQIDERVYPYRTSKMLLQPIVENCIVHGFSGNIDSAELTVIGELEGEEAVIRVKDNGCGISSERIDYLLSRNSTQIGLSNIHQRLRLMYGEEYGLQIISEKEQGTEVVIRFPKKSSEKGE